ncbi:Uncharacterized conserved protein GlcG, DUF336 family [Epibacterium ulvae]|uniref:Uncharacterized conserved protein GlcG, DUF336 family n=1 Tax=Epibacterium ulvae TaxID=1156985 RepID=A0A1G5QEW7_9RHOB|nr:heme-binding protein [Epibacterium ulvae]SCZ59891.1 Uncharacterized conserved protein GlcG, DUF336 family [Epibacterium ulvae]
MKNPDFYLVNRLLRGLSSSKYGRNMLKHLTLTFKSLTAVAMVIGGVSSAFAQDNEPPVAQTVPLPYGMNVSASCAAAVADTAIEFARSNGWNVTVAVSDTAGQVIVLHRMDNAHRASTAFALEKATSAALTKRSTKVFSDALSNGRMAILGFTNLHVHAAEGGEVIVADNTIVGAIGAAGVTEKQDRLISLAGIEALSNC